ncbi:pentatricopeptide repeat (PPR) superfamily protein [Actinidia rufa]|uniref:Pentatricopeptide repeat (PPR) superfamily protein n=1 Tax=Actinidia rufa TaxID=165716 RepID=A0A7J0E914_9ERIC|nr:pentatricopeptide repeat (PPR) superfamily protein [Actinidia rufa]
MKQLHQVHAQIQVSGLHRDPNIVNKITHFCALHPSGCLSHARLVMTHSSDSVLSSWNNLIRGHATRCSSREAMWVFVEMRGHGFRPDKLTYPFLFKACAAISVLKEGEQIHTDVVKSGLDSDVYVGNTLIHFYGSCGKIGDAHKVFDEMTIRTVVSWNSIVSACVENSKFRDSVELFFRMRDCGFEPDEANYGDFAFGLCRGWELEFGQVGSLSNLYCASLVFERMIIRNVWTWSAMILGLAQHGRAMEALELFKQMKNNGIKPNYVTFLGALCACSHAGLVEDGYRFFRDMQYVHKVKPVMAHYGAIVDCFGRAGRLTKAYTFIKNMPVKPDAVIWRTLLNACNIHDVNDYSGVGEMVRKSLLELEPRRSGNFVMVANKYAEVGMWEKVECVRSGMRDRGLKKMAGVSSVQVDSSIHRFFSGDDFQVAYNGIYLLLDRLNLHMKMVNFESSI